MLVVLLLLRWLRMQHVLIEMLDDILARPMLPHQAGLIFPHLARDLVRHGIDRGIHVVCLLEGLDRDVIRADEHDLRGVPVFRDFQNHVGFDDFWVIEVKAFDLPRYVIADRIGNLEVTSGDFDIGMGVGRYHVFAFLHLEPFTEV